MSWWNLYSTKEELKNKWNFHSIQSSSQIKQAYSNTSALKNTPPTSYTPIWQDNPNLSKTDGSPTSKETLLSSPIPTSQLKIKKLISRNKYIIPQNNNFLLTLEENYQLLNKSLLLRNCSILYNLSTLILSSKKGKMFLSTSIERPNFYSSLNKISERSAIKLSPC